jgi:hypothetical protein
MKPPRCHVCGLGVREDSPRPLNESFVLVDFADVPEMPPGWAGHPRGALWFCRQHAQLGQERESMSSADALAEIDIIHPRRLPPFGADNGIDQVS